MSVPSPPIATSTLIPLEDASTLSFPDSSPSASSNPFDDPSSSSSSSSNTALPPNHIGPVSTSSTNAYEPAILARTTLSNGNGKEPERGGGGGPRVSGELAAEGNLPRRRFSQESDDEAWDDWGNGNDATVSKERLSGGGSGGRGGASSSREHLELDREIKDLEDQDAEDAAAGGSAEVWDQKLKKALYWRHVLVTGIFVILWYAFSTCISLYNKWVFGPKYFGFPFPMFMTFCQMIVQFFLASIVRYSMPDRFKPPCNPNLRDYGLRVTPTGVSTALDIGLSNLSLKTITLSLYTMCKSSTLIFVLIFAFAFRLEAYSLRLVGVIGLITAGVFLMAYNTTAVSIPGTIMVFSASALGGLRWALTHSLMIKEELGMTNPFATIFWITPLMGLTLAIVSMATDGWGNVFGSEFFADGRALETIALIIFPGVLAFSMVACEYYIIQRAGIVPLSVAGVFKEVTTISIASWAFGDELTPVNFAGLFVTMIGIGFFTHHKYQKSMSEPLDAHGGALPRSTEDDESHPLTSMGERSSREGAFSTPTSGGFWSFLSPTPTKHEAVPYVPITVFADDEPGVAAADTSGGESARERYERGEVEDRNR